ncbi:MAG: hypothetical protein ACAI35_14950 [Candidatus Methylacidiphilales bacterium]|nr:hypothetical protein [Candidatus Methylacidiphilales bacterium]
MKMSAMKWRFLSRAGAPDASPYCNRQVRRDGFALVVTICLIFIVSITILAFITAMKMDRQATQTYSQNIRADQVAQGALASIESWLTDEITSGSTTYGADGTLGSSTAPLIYWPKDRTSMLMQSSPATPVLPMPLRKISRNAAPFSTGGIALASSVKTTTVSANGRLFPLTRWNKPRFFDTWPTGVAAPDWIHVTRNGPRDVDVTTARDARLSNMDMVVGRYAYAIYDVSGLLDLTAAGYPSTGSDLTADFIARKGNLALADLTQIPNGTGNLTTAQINTIAQWRNKASLPAYKSYLTNSVVDNGGTRVYPGDNTFVNRQDLIQYAQANGFDKALPNFTTFHRSQNAPSFAPDKNGTGALYMYKDSANATSSVNRNIPNTRVKVEFTRADGTAAAVGSPLVAQRFALSRIALLSESAPDASKMLKYFGLTGAGGNGTWTYNHGDPNRIMTLDEVSLAGREPDFFELLKAAILNGSLGRDSGAYLASGSTASGPYSKVQSISQVPDVQILRIGANIMDQYDANSFPTAIYCKIFTPDDNPANTVYGIEDLPYLLRVAQMGQDTTPPKFDGSTSYAGVWIEPIIWNPHQPSGGTGLKPDKLRVQAFGRAVARVSYYNFSGDKAPVPPATLPTQTQQLAVGPPSDFGLTPETGTPAGRIEFYANQDFRSTPVALLESHADTDPSATPGENVPGKAGQPSDWPRRPAGIALLPCPYKPDQRTLLAPNGTSLNKTYFEWQQSATISFAMQYKDPTTGIWHTYAVMNQLGRAISVGRSKNNINTTTGSFGNDSTGDSFQIYDARTDRFGVSIPHMSIPTSYGLNNTIRPTATSIRAFMMGWGAPTSGFAYSTSPNASSVWFYPGHLTRNQSDSAMRYTDVDGVLRGGDGMYITTPASTVDGNPLALNTATDVAGSQRPVILNRAFRSVGELGYAFRDLPFKSIDFFSDDSADAALLDIFSVNDAPIEAAKVNLNTATLPVLKSLLKGGLKKETDASQVLDGDVNAIATHLFTQLNASPIMNRGDLLKPLGSALTPLLTSATDKANKTQREAVIRSLSEVTDIRTWNLMIDVVAQAGRFNAQAGTLDAFTVEGEKRYWLHIALDRFTGKVISSRLEPVYE